MFCSAIFSRSQRTPPPPTPTGHGHPSSLLASTIIASGLSTHRIVARTVTAFLVCVCVCVGLFVRALFFFVLFAFASEASRTLSLSFRLLRWV